MSYWEHGWKRPLWLRRAGQKACEEHLDCREVMKAPRGHQVRPAGSPSRRPWWGYGGVGEGGERAEGGGWEVKKSSVAEEWHEQQEWLCGGGGRVGGVYRLASSGKIAMPGRPRRARLSIEVWLWLGAVEWGE